MDDVEPVELGAATRFLAERYGSGVDGVSELGGGDWSRAFAFTLDGRELVARFGLYKDDFLRDRAAMSFAGPHLPVPVLVEVGDALGGAYAVSERHHGAFLESLGEEGWRTVLPALFRALDAMREVPVVAGSGCEWHQDGGADATTWREWLLMSIRDVPDGRVSGWRERIAASAEHEEVFVRAESALLESVGDMPELRHVLHTDFLNRNVLVAEDCSRLTAVFDWGGLVYGDFVYEVAWFTFWGPRFPGLAPIDVAGAVRDHYGELGLAVPDLDGRLRCYELHIGLVHLAYNAFRHRQEEFPGLLARIRTVLDGG